MFLESFVFESTALGLPVRTQRILMRVALVLKGISASCLWAAWRTEAGSRDDMTIDLSTRRGTSACANIFRLT